MRIPLVGGFYQSRSLIANAQKAVNLYTEINPKDSPSPTTQYPTAGLDLLIEGPVGAVRCTFTSSAGELFRVVGTGVYYVAPDWSETLLGTISNYGTPVSMEDNGLVVLIVDGTSDGYAIDMMTHQFGKIAATNFYGSNRVAYLDTFMLFNRPGTNQWYISLSNSTFDMFVNQTPTAAFDPLDIAAKVGYPDPIQSIIVMHREVWLVGEKTTEIWYNAGNPDFTFGTQPGAFIEHGTVAKYSLVTQDLAVYWLSQDKQGQCVVMRGAGYAVQRISTHALENEFSKYATVSDAIGYTYQMEGHTICGLIFPSANKTWEYDEASKLWNERAWTNNNGILNRHRINCCANAYGKIVVGDWENGNLYAFNINNYTDNGNPITHIRSFPHIVNDGDRIIFNSFMADMECGQTLDLTDDPKVSLRWSIDRGQTYGNAVLQSLGKAGDYRAFPQWSRLGYARDMVFELSWSVNAKTALNGAWVTTNQSAT